MKFVESQFVCLYWRVEKQAWKNWIYLYFLGQDIHLSEFSKKHPKNADLFFQVKMGGGV